MSEENDDVKTNNWRFTKDFSIGNLLTLIGMVLMLFAWGQTIEKRIVILEERTQAMTTIAVAQDKQYDKDRNELLKKLERMEEKLDYLLNGQRTIKKLF